MFKRYLQQKRAESAAAGNTKFIKKGQRIYILQSHVGLLVEFQKNASGYVQYLASSGMDNCIGLVMWASLDMQTTRGLLTHLDAGCCDFMQKYIEEFIGMFGSPTTKITAQLILPLNPNTKLAEASKDALLRFQGRLGCKEDKKDEINRSTDFCLDLDNGEAFFYKESVLGISSKYSKLSLNHPINGQILRFFELSGNNIIPKDLPDTMEPTPQQILYLSCMLGDVDKAKEILSANRILINEYDVETGYTPLLYAIYAIIGETKLENFITATKADILRIPSKKNLEVAVKASRGLESREDWQINIIQLLLSAGADMQQVGGKDIQFSPWIILKEALENTQKRLVEHPKPEILQQLKERCELLEKIKEICEASLQQRVDQSSK